MWYISTVLCALILCSLTIILSMLTSSFSCSTVFRASAILAMLFDILPHWSQPVCSKCLVTRQKNNRTHHWWRNQVAEKHTNRGDICATVRVCFNLLVNSAPWVSAASGTGRVSKEQRRAGEAKQPSPGGYPLAENVNTPNIDINSWCSWYWYCCCKLLLMTFLVSTKLLLYCSVADTQWCKRLMLLNLLEVSRWKHH